MKLFLTRTRTPRWWIGLGLELGDDDSDSDLTIWTRTQHCFSLPCIFFTLVHSILTCWGMARWGWRWARLVACEASGMFPGSWPSSRSTCPSGTHHTQPRGVSDSTCSLWSCLVSLYIIAKQTLLYNDKRKQLLKMTFLVNEQKVSVMYMYIDINAISGCLDLNNFQQDECFCSKLGIQVEYAKFNLKTSLSQIWVIGQLLPFVIVQQYRSSNFVQLCQYLK